MAATEAAGLKTVSAIRYRIANVSTDEVKLSEALETQLVPLLEHASSQHKPVRDAAFQAYISVTKLIQPPSVVLPVAALLRQYKTTGSPVVKQLDLGLVKKGLARLDQSKRRSLLPVVTASISNEPNQAGSAGIFIVLLRLLLEIQVPPRGSKEDIALRDSIGLASVSDAQYVSRWLGKLFLLRQDMATASNGTELARLLASSPTGLNSDEVNFLRASDPKTWDHKEPGSLSLPECKLKAIGLLASGAFTDEERFLPAFCAAGLADSRVTSTAEDLLKRTKVNLEDHDVVQRLFALHSELPASHRIQILQILSKSVAACRMGNLVVQLVKDDFALTTGETAPVGGLESLRLHKALLGFLAWMARNSSGAAIDAGPSLVLLLKDYILQQGWPNAASAANQFRALDEQRLRATAYETIGTLARASQFEHKVKDSLLKWLFDSLVSDSTSDIIVYIESALSSMMSLFKSNHEDDHHDLEILLVDYMTLPERQGLRTAKHVAARFANNCLPYNNVKARWVDLIALGGGSSERRDILEEGQKGLDPWWSTKLRPDEALVLPDWTKLIDWFFDLASRDTSDDQMSIDQRSAYPLFADERLRAFPAAIRYVTQMVKLAAVGDSAIEIDWEPLLERRLQNELPTRAKLRGYLASGNHKCLVRLLNAALDGIRDHPDVGEEDCIRSFAEIVLFAPVDGVIRELAPRVGELLSLLKSNNQRVRKLAAEAFGIIAPWNEHAAAYLSQLRNAVESSEEPPAALSGHYQGSLAFLGSYMYHAALYGRLSGEVVSQNAEVLTRVFMSAMQYSDGQVQTASIEVIGRLWTVNLAFPVGGDGFKKVISYLERLGESHNEAAITALGRLAVPSAANSDAVDSVLDALFGLSDIKRTEVHFAIGEAIAAAIFRWNSDAMLLGLDIESPVLANDTITQTLCRRQARIPEIVEKLISGCKATKPSLLKASGIWLFCLIQYGSHLEEIQNRLRECQVAFTRLLAARDELVQETASRGLALVYEKGDPSLRSDLVKDLVATFTGTKTQLKVDDDTELFDAGALPTGEGKSVTSYKDIINLANEVGDQTLIYKFMALATNAATWTARSAFGKFGLSTILSDAELDPKIYPKLYRYRFDPNSNVRRSMDDIWKAVVKDPTTALDIHFDAIMDDLLKSILDGREWRVREASCAAIADLIYGQPFQRYEKYYTNVWRVALRVLDDQKGSVREAAMKLCMGLSKTLVAQLQENNATSSAKAMVAQVLPFLLSEKGIENSVKEVQYMAIMTVLDVVKNGGDTLKPFIPTIVIHCLGLLGTIEPEAINYHYQRVGEQDREKLDKLRSNAATRSPLFECILNCLRFADDEVMKQLVPQLAQTIKSAIGLQTKVGCAEILSTLSLRHSILLPPYNTLLLKSMESHILERNHEDDSRRQKVADTVLAIAKISQDVFGDLETRLLPLAYVAKHDTDEYVSEEFEAVWGQHAGGDHTVMRFVEEIVQCVSVGLGTSQWALQHSAALTMASLLTAISNVVGRDGQFSTSVLQKTWPVLDKSLALKTFPGKERLIKSFPVFVRHSKPMWSSDAAVAAQTKKIALREAKRNNDAYRPHALEALAVFAAEREDLDMYSEVLAVASPHLGPQDEAKGDLTEMERTTMAAALRVVMSAYNRPRLLSKPMEVLETVVSEVEKTKLARSVARDTFFACATDLFKAALASEAPSSSDSGALASRWVAVLTIDETDAMVENQRSGRAKALEALGQGWSKGIFGPREEQGSVREEAQERIRSMVESERSLDVQRLLRLATVAFS
ncbi:proteasome-associated ECM29 like [Apiospora hydei]|uniref:Proteasome-associated ECM29 like n=1 Tax=Apiospora hydei TaxID=1337664 RepID=A0ABR1X0V2_9PEZI